MSIALSTLYPTYRAIYAANLWVKPFPAQDGVKKVRETSKYEQSTQ